MKNPEERRKRPLRSPNRWHKNHPTMKKRPPQCLSLAEAPFLISLVSYLLSLQRLARDRSLRAIIQPTTLVLAFISLVWWPQPSACPRMIVARAAHMCLVTEASGSSVTLIWHEIVASPLAGTRAGENRVESGIALSEPTQAISPAPTWMETIH